MQPQNVAEYTAIREELTTLKNCITNYVGFVVAGSATAFWGLAGRASEKGPERLAMATMAMLLAIVSVLILFVLSYKFTSHNRYVGYSKLLTHEKFLQGVPADIDIFSWEICLDWLRAADFDPNPLLIDCDALGKAIKSAGNLRAEVAPYLGPSASRDQSSMQKGAALLVWRSSREDSGSWWFPLYVTRIFAAIDVVFISFAIYFFFFPLSKYWYFCIFIFLFSALILLWMKFLSKLHKQMGGSETIEAFCWKFVPIRVKFLRELAPDIGYELLAVDERHREIEVSSRTAAPSRTIAVDLDKSESLPVGGL